MERTATHDTEYIDIVLGYHHILLFSLIFGVLVFGSGYFIGYYRAQGDGAQQSVSRTTSPSPTPSSNPSTPPLQMPAMLTQPPPSDPTDVVREMEEVSTESIAPAEETGGETSSAPTAAATPAPSEPAAPPAPQTAPSPEPATATPEPRSTRETPTPTPPAAPASAPPSQPVNQQASTKPPNASGNVYLQVSSFGEQQQAEKLIDDLAVEGFRALIDGQLIEGRHTVLVGPFSDFKSAVGKAKELKQRNREAFPIRR